MLIYFKEDEVVINTENVSSIEYINPSHSLSFNVNGQRGNVEIFFPTKEEALKTLDTILAAYNTQQKLLVIYDKKMGNNEKGE